MESAGLDLEIIRAIQEIGSYRANDHLLQELFELYASQSKEALREIEAALGAQEFLQVKRYAHRLKGSAGSLGAVEVARLCASLEHLGEGGLGELGRIEAGFADLKAAVDRSLDELARHLPS